MKFLSNALGRCNYPALRTCRRPQVARPL